MTVKTFANNKAHAINYFKKVRENEKIDFSFVCLSAEYHGWVVIYSYK